MEPTRFHNPGQPKPPPERLTKELRTLGGYRLLRLLGEGGMGSVFLAFKEGDEEPIAIKILNENLTSTPGFVDRFYREAYNGTQLNHPHIVRTFRVDQDRGNGLHYLVMEYVDGPSAQALLNRHNYLSAEDAVHIILGVSRALEHAHSRHIIHRDIKPDNILLNRSSVAKLADLGLAKNLEEDSNLTQIHQGFGTTPYMPPEQAKDAREADERGDIYALGATFYHLVTGVVPFVGNNELDIFEKKFQGHYPPAQSIRPEIPDRVDRLLRRMLASEPARRFQSATELIAALVASKLAPLRPSFSQEDFSAASFPALPLDSNAPTRLKVDVTPQKEGASPATNSQVWYLRYRDLDGNLYNRRATTEQIVRRLQQGLLPGNAEARKPSQEGFFPLLHYPELNPDKGGPHRSLEGESPPEGPVPPGR